MDRARQLPRSHRPTPRPPLSPDPVVRTTPGPLPPSVLPLRAAIAIAPGPGAREKGGGRSPPLPIAIRSSAAAPAPVVRASGSTGPDPFPSSPGAVGRRPRDAASCRDMAAPGPQRDAGSQQIGPGIRRPGPARPPPPVAPAPSSAPLGVARGPPATLAPRGVRVRPRRLRGAAPSASAPRRVNAGSPGLRRPPSRSRPFCGRWLLGGPASSSGLAPLCEVGSPLPGPLLPSAGATSPLRGCGGDDSLD